MNKKMNIEMSWWAMEGVDASETNYALSQEEQVRRIAEAGYDGINGLLPKRETAANWFRMLDEYELSFSVNTYPRSPAELKAFLDEVKTYSNITYVNAQVMTPFITGEPAVQLLREMRHISKEAGIPVFVETHRGTITQDLIRTCEYVSTLADLPLTIDFSHYVVAGEMHTISEEGERLLQELLPHTASIHARVSNGEQVQIDPGMSLEHPMMEHFQRWWRDAMRGYLLNKNADSILPVVMELGPPPYAITIDESSSRKRELGSRWQQSLRLMELMRSLWQQAITNP